MKRALALMILLVYGLSSTGMTIHFHYCCGKLDKIDFSAIKEKSCSSHAQIKKTSCCEDKQLELKQKSVQNSEKLVTTYFQPTALKTFQFVALSSNVIVEKKFLPEVFAPPAVGARAGRGAVPRNPLHQPVRMTC